MSTKPLPNDRDPAAMLWNLYTVWRGRGSSPAKVWSVTRVLAAPVVLWFAPISKVIATTVGY